MDINFINVIKVISENTTKHRSTIGQLEPFK